MISEMYLFDGQKSPRVQVVDHKYDLRTPRKPKFDPTLIMQGVKGSGVQIH